MLKAKYHAIQVNTELMMEELLYVEIVLQDINAPLSINYQSLANLDIQHNLVLLLVLNAQLEIIVQH